MTFGLHVMASQIYSTFVGWGPCGSISFSPSSSSDVHGGIPFTIQTNNDTHPSSNTHARGKSNVWRFNVGHPFSFLYSDPPESQILGLSKGFQVSSAYDPFGAYVQTSQSPIVGLCRSAKYILDPMARGDLEGSSDLRLLSLHKFCVRRFLHLEPYFLQECQTPEVSGTRYEEKYK